MRYQLGRVLIDLQIVKDEGGQYIAPLGLQSAGDTYLGEGRGLVEKFSDAHKAIRLRTGGTIDSPIRECWSVLVCFCKLYSEYIRAWPGCKVAVRLLIPLAGAGERGGIASR